MMLLASSERPFARRPLSGDEIQVRRECGDTRSLKSLLSHAIAEVGDTLPSRSGGRAP